MNFVSRLVHLLRRTVSAWRQSGRSGLTRTGDWRVVYGDSQKTGWLMHGEAKSLRNIFGGVLEWRYDRSVSDADRCPVRTRTGARP